MLDGLIEFQLDRMGISQINGAERSWTKRELATDLGEALTNKNIGQRLMNAIIEKQIAEDDAVQALERACGLDPDGPPHDNFNDVTFDSYDCSFEFKNCRLGWEPTEAQLKTCLALGFYRCWLCYTDGSEIYFGKDGLSKDGDFCRKPARGVAEVSND